jgi:hypothetical protein
LGGTISALAGGTESAIVVEVGTVGTVDGAGAVVAGRAAAAGDAWVRDAAVRDLNW